MLAKIVVGKALENFIDDRNIELTKVFSSEFCAIWYIGLGNISILSFIVIFKCHDKSISKRFFSIVVSPAQYYR